VCIVCVHMCMRACACVCVYDVVVVVDATTSDVVAHDDVIANVANVIDVVVVSAANATDRDVVDANS